MSTVERCRVHLLVQHLSERRGPSCAWYDSRESVLVRLVDSDGRTGWGEACLRPGVVEAASQLGAGLVGLDASQHSVLVDGLQASSADPWAVSALAIALDDLRARALGVPVADLYGGRRRDRVRPYASSGGYHPERGPEELWGPEVAEARAAGFDAFKLRIGRFEPRRELPLLAALRQQVGDAFDLLCDGNGAYTLREAIAVGRVLEQLGFVWFEEPMIRERGSVRHPGYEKLAAALDIAVAGGEGLTSRGELLSLLERGAVDVVQPDVTICGGIGEALFVAELAALRGIGFAPHCWGGAVAVAATLQLLAVVPHPAEVPDRDGPFLEHDIFENAMRSELATEAIKVRGGAVSIPAGPGLGIELDEEVIRRFDVLGG
ncbi:MAG TPA: mandelate racemase/muconate lactonizing enzyme family protein [Acidimicrobiales bacterium]|nr:mandelate racemase/muconate lactonizing enzyme family protein [Acidimicrobiales bacterium]